MIVAHRVAPDGPGAAPRAALVSVQGIMTALTRNDETVAMAKAIPAQMGRPSPAWRRARHAREWCESCGRCGQTIAPGEPVRLAKVHVGGASVTPPTCAACRPRWERDRDFRQPAPCGGRGRLVSVLRRGRPRTVIACSEQCDRTVRNRRRCPICKAEFVATRSDNRYCTAACRQKAYRSRAALDSP